MSSTSSEVRQSPWKGGDFALPVFLFFPAADFAAIYGDQAKTLGIPGAGIAQAAWVLMLLSFLFIPLLLSSGPLAYWRHGITVAAGFFCLLFPVLLLECGSVGIPLTRQMTTEEVSALREKFGIPTVLISSSGEGWRLKIRRSNYSDALRGYVSSLGVSANAPPAAR